MNDQSPNEQFEASSFLQGANADYVEQLYANYAADPSSVDASWQAFFASLGDAESDVKKSAEGASWAARTGRPSPRAS